MERGNADPNHSFGHCGHFLQSRWTISELKNGEMPYFCGEKISLAWTVATEKEDISGDSFAKSSDSTESLISKKFLDFYL